jgi:hypothetical protein
MRGTFQKKVVAEMLRRGKTAALEAQSGCCKYCFEPLTVRLATAEHRVPKSKGGSNLAHNIDAACADCNLAKATMTAGAFLKAVKQPEGHGFHIWRAWMRRRLWLATHRACRNIGYAAGLMNTTPLGRKAA